MDIGISFLVFWVADLFIGLHINSSMKYMCIELCGMIDYVVCGFEFLLPFFRNEGSIFWSKGIRFFFIVFLFSTLLQYLEEYNSTSVRTLHFVKLVFCVFGSGTSYFGLFGYARM